MFPITFYLDHTSLGEVKCLSLVKGHCGIQFYHYLVGAFSHFLSESENLAQESNSFGRLFETLAISKGIWKLKLFL